MSPDERLRLLRDAVQVDVGNRGLARDPDRNLLNACPDDLANACRSLAEHPAPVLAVVTGFFIPSAGLGETDGPLGAVYLARTLPALGVRVLLVGDPFCRRALEAGLEACGLLGQTPVLDVPEHPGGAWWGGGPAPTHVLALERVGPSHRPTSVRAQPGADEAIVRAFLDEVPADHHNRCHTMRGIDITPHTRDASWLFEDAHALTEPPRRAGSVSDRRTDAADGTRLPPVAHAPGSPGPVTLGVGDGGNEIGMGKVPWDVIRRNIPGGAVIACRVAADHLVVAGVSNWGAYALAAGAALARGVRPPAGWFDLDAEEAILRVMVEQGPLVDGVLGRPAVSVDGLPFAPYASPLRRIGEIARS
jgi:hypothetical protein